MKSLSSSLTDFSTGAVHLWAGFPIGVLHNSEMSMALEVEGEYLPLCSVLVCSCPFLSVSWLHGYVPWEGLSAFM